MSTIFQIFKNDLKSIAKSKIAIIVVIGIIIIPGIYAWLNIDSNWSPYDNTGNIPIAVVNKDKGATIAGEEFNIGNSLADSLKENHDMKWTFTDEQSAMDGVEQSSFYGAIIIPEDFSHRLTTILDSTNPEKPTFDYYINDKKNPIAPIIAAKAAGAIQDGTNQAFVNTLVYKAADAAKTIGLIEKGTDTANSLISKLADTKTKVGQLRDINRTATLAIDTTGKSLSALESIIPTLESFNNAAEQGIIDAKNGLNSLNDITFSSIQELTDQISAEIAELENIENTLNNILPPSEELAHITEKIQNVINNLNSIHDKFQTAANTELNNIYQNVSNALDGAENIITSLDSSLNSLKVSMQYAVQALQSGTQLGNSLDPVLANFQSDIDTTIAAINAIKDSEIFKNLMALLQNNPDTIADFVSSPIAANEIKVYPISTYGSEMAPFYSVLACWVGCTILVAIISIDIKKSKTTAKAKNYQKFLGRFMLFGSIAMLQGLAIGTGDLIMHVQTVSWPLFLFTLMLSSLVFSLIIYALSVVFGKIGQALSIVVLVLQVAGSGGTFPIELLPKLFQTLQPFMPFCPAMNATRETVGGFYQDDYSINILILLCHFTIALIFGLIFSRHTFETKGKLQKELHKTGLID
ncbi:YhgE/Pip domain-containing protein [Candidatus Saccharibacteria bacterium]|nr:YhgE/Pip domain-containing protein [Candidatus Saccharibacteria bacterium]